MNPEPSAAGESLPTGAETMSPAMRDLQAYPRYLFDCVRVFLGQRVWEIGVGYGTYTALLRQSQRSVLATDLDAGCLQAVRTRFAADPAVQTARVDLTDAASIQAVADYRADSILCFNVLEHIQDDVQALRWMRQAVQPQAVLTLIVPAHQRLYGRMDAEAGHFRRYSRQTLTRALADAGWTLQQSRYLNLTGAAGWWYHNRWRRSAGLADNSVNRQMRAVDRWLPRLARLTDPLCGRLAGLSVLAVGRNGEPVS